MKLTYNSRASSNKKLCDDLLLLLIQIQYKMVAIREDKHVGTPLFLWLALFGSDSIILRPIRLMQIVEVIVKQEFGRELARTGVKSFRLERLHLELLKSCKPLVPDLTPVRKTKSWDDA